MTGVRFSKARPSWLQNTSGKRMELDGYAPSLGLAFEYQGAQHYHYNPFFHENAEFFERRRACDERKRRLCRRQGIVLLEVPYHISRDGLQVYLATLLDRAVTRNGWRWIIDAHRGDGRRCIVDRTSC